MKITRNDHFVKIDGVDNNGPFCIEIQNDCSQIRLETSDYTETYIDIDYVELKLIRDVITEVLKAFEVQINIIDE